MRGESLPRYIAIKNKAVGLIPGFRWELTSATPTTGDTLWYDGSAWVNRAPTQSATIASGAVTASGPWVTLLIVDTESAAASDDLDTISGGTSGQMLVLRATDNARTVVAKDNTGNLRLTADFNLNHSRDTLTLMFSDPNWLEVARSDNEA